MTVTAATLAAWSNFDPPEEGSDDEALVDLVIAAVTAHVIDNYRVPDDPAEFTDAQNMAVLLQAARLWKRKDTPQGTAAFADVAAIRVDRLDGDVAVLLTPRFGFA